MHCALRALLAFARTVVLSVIFDFAEDYTSARTSIRLRARDSARCARYIARPAGFEPATTGFEGLYKGTASDMPNGKTAAANTSSDTKPLIGPAFGPPISGIALSKGANWPSPSSVAILAGRRYRFNM